MRKRQVLLIPELPPKTPRFEALVSIGQGSHVYGWLHQWSEGIALNAVYPMLPPNDAADPASEQRSVTIFHWPEKPSYVGALSAIERICQGGPLYLVRLLSSSFLQVLLFVGSFSKFYRPFVFSMFSSE